MHSSHMASELEQDEAPKPAAYRGGVMNQEDFVMGTTVQRSGLGS